MKEVSRLELAPDVVADSKAYPKILIKLELC